VLADRGLYAKWLYELIVDMHWHPFLRINRGGKVRPQGEASFDWLSTLVPQVGSSWCGQVECFVEVSQRLQCTLLACWEAGYADPWLVLTDLPAEAANVVWYSMRTWVEAGFKDTKRGGWQWHQTKMSDPARASRLWLAIAVATLWVVKPMPRCRVVVWKRCLNCMWPAAGRASDHGHDCTVALRGAYASSWWPYCKASRCLSAALSQSRGPAPYRHARRPNPRRKRKRAKARATRGTKENKALLQPLPRRQHEKPTSERLGGVPRSFFFSFFASEGLCWRMR